MTGKALLLIIGSVGLSAFAQIVLKVGMSGDAARGAMDHTSLLQGYIRLLVIPAVVGGLVAYGLSALLWLRVLAELDVGKAYPFVALSIVVTMASGALFLGEPVPMLRVVGAALVIVGVLLVGMS